MIRSDNKQRGWVDGWMIGTFGFLALFLIVGGLAIWMTVSYFQAKDNVDNKVALAEAKARSEQAETDQEKYDKEAKNPRVEFVGPSEYGRVSFMYPKTWSAYVDKDGTDRRSFKAYFHPETVPPVGSKDSRFALRLEIMNQDFDKVLSKYSNKLKKGELKSSSVEYNGLSATRLDGAFSKELRGSAVFMKVRDKTIQFSTDAKTFNPDFKEILDTVKFVE